MGLSQEEFFSGKPKFDADFDELKTKLFLYIAEVIRKIVYSKELDFEEIEREQTRSKFGAVAMSHDWTKQKKKQMAYGWTELVHKYMEGNSQNYLKIVVEVMLLNTI